MGLKPEGATHKDKGPSFISWLRITDKTHDYWQPSTERWVTFEGGHNALRSHWVKC